MISRSVIAIVLALISFVVPVATADPVDTTSVTAPDGSRLEAVIPIDSRNLALSVYAESMQRSIPVQVLRAADTTKPRPTLYLLDGVTRQEKTDAMAFFADKNVNVVIPTGGENAW